ncbi:MAG: glycosyltransferase family 2 protein [Bacteroidales bacterium]|nr:glycosyltransferase family 2 protein [Bacteroidales bacterium]
MSKILSIIIPTYNMEKYVGQCLASMTSSEVPDTLEVIAVNDGSKDGSLAILNSFREKRPDIVKVIDKPNGNYGSCINAALPQCTGKYVRVVDADDWVETEQLVQYLEHLSEIDVDMSLTTFKTIDATGNATDWSFVGNRTGIMTIEELFSEEPNLTLPMHRIVYRTQLLRDINYVQTEGISYTDSEWAYKPILHVKTVDVSNYNVYRYRVGRIGQTMDPKVIIKSLTQENILMVSLMEYRQKVLSTLSNKLKEFADFVVCRKALLIYTQSLLTASDKDFNAEVVDTLENTLAKYSKELYDVMATYDARCFVVRYWRNSHKRYNAMIRKAALFALDLYKTLKK